MRRRAGTDRDSPSDRFERSSSHTKPQDRDLATLIWRPAGAAAGHSAPTRGGRSSDKDGLSDGREIRIRTDPRESMLTKA